jgi:hypothetical protein
MLTKVEPLEELSSDLHNLKTLPSSVVGLQLFKNHFPLKHDSVKVYHTFRCVTLEELQMQLTWVLASEFQPLPLPS